MTSSPPAPSHALVAVQHATVRGLLALPDAAVRRLAGATVVVEGAVLDAETQLVLRLQRLLRKDGREHVPVAVGRRDLDTQVRLVAGALPIGSVEDRSLGGIAGRVYVPAALTGSTCRPTLVFLHGGGFVYGGLASHDAVCRFLAEQAGVQVIAVDYRLAPEHPFPAAYDDAVAAYRWVLDHAAELATDSSRLVVGGDSAGGNLAAGIAIEAARHGWPLAGQVLVYPVTDAATQAASRATFATGFYLTELYIELATDRYLPRPDDRKDPRASPIYADLRSALAPAVVVTAGFDPLRDEGEAYAVLLREAGTTVIARREPGLVHGFLNWVGVGRSARAAAHRVAADLARLVG